MKARISLNKRGESILSIGNTLGGGEKKIAKEAKMNKKPLGCIVANLCANVTNSNTKKPNPKPN